MRRADRLFEIVQKLRLAARPLTAARLAEDLEVSVRSIYRDIAALQGARVPIEGDRGVGYILRPGFDLPPLMFSIDEIEAITLALRLLDRTGDVGLLRAAGSVRDKIAGALPGGLRPGLDGEALLAWGRGVPPPAFDLHLVRRAIRDERKLDLDYVDQEGRVSTRRIRPIALVYYVEVAVIAAWCEARAALRHFRADRVRSCTASEAFFTGEGEELRRLWRIPRLEA